MYRVDEHQKAQHIHVDGVVQGVGFRPYVYRLARDLGLKGWVMNRNDGVHIHIEGPDALLSRFSGLLPLQSPPPARIQRMEVHDTTTFQLQEFSIRASESIDHAFTGISPDIATCQDCLEDLLKQSHRKNYPLINCTHCGPRFTIIRHLPYDRKETTMAAFPMCPLCRSEYLDPANRRFHAQPVACNHCGPVYHMEGHGRTWMEMESLLQAAVDLLENGGVIALKSTGGFNLICDARNESAVIHIRSMKHRKTKPLAVMFRNIGHIRAYCELSVSEQEWMEGWRRPIMLLPQHTPLAKSVNPGLGMLGSMLPNMAFHHLLFEKLGNIPLVFTSANMSGAPIPAEETEVRTVFGEAVDAVITHNRPVLHPIDDSVCQYSAEGIQVIRRARGFVPESMALALRTEGIFAAGSDMKSAFALGRDKQVIMGPYLGDLADYDVYQRYQFSLAHFKDLFRFFGSLVVADLHPAYQASALAAEKAGEWGAPLIRVQHHHAHLAAVMAEHGLAGPVIGICFDGTGYGDDGSLWGSEFMLCGYDGYTRYAHFRNMLLPGGEKAIFEPWRIALAMMLQIQGTGFDPESLPPWNTLSKEALQAVSSLIGSGMQCVPACGAGRLFDAVAALLGVCPVADYDGQAPMLLEALCLNDSGQGYFIETDVNIDVYELMNQIFLDLQKGTSKALIATRFHLGMANLIARMAIRMRVESGLNQVVLSGGVFQNRFLLNRTAKELKSAGFHVFTNQQVPVNDGGLALGQMAIAAWQREKQDVS